MCVCTWGVGIKVYSQHGVRKGLHRIKDELCVRQPNLLILSRSPASCTYLIAVFPIHTFELWYLKVVLGWF